MEHSQIKQMLEELLGRTGFKKYNKAFLNVSATQSKEQSEVITINGVPIELNTIAGIKGETHTATLVLETFFHKHNIEDAIKTMLTGSAKEKNNDTAIKRIKHLYVAMTRPTRFLCLALPQNSYLNLCKNPKIKSWFDDSFVIDKTLLDQQ
jgi:putative heme iron utilization protein